MITNGSHASYVAVCVVFKSHRDMHMIRTVLKGVVPDRVKRALVVRETSV